ncbi:MAG: hypothetical protein R2838_20565 [Caldilineaceae bacterium]
MAVGTIIAARWPMKPRMHLEQTALAALAKLGVTTDLRGGFGGVTPLSVLSVRLWAPHWKMSN